MIIYLDLILLENLLIDFIIIYTTSLILKYRIKFIKLVFSSLIGSISIIIIYLFKLNNFIETIFKLLIPIIMILLSFGYKDLKKLLKDILSFYLVTFTYGGISTFLLYFFHPAFSNGMIVGIFSFKKLFIGMIIGFLLIVLVFKITKNIFLNGKTFCKMKIIYNNKNVEAIAMIDTGNLLKDVITGYPVSIVEKDVVCKIISKEIINNMEKIVNGKNLLEEKIDKEKDFKIIPYNSIGNNNRTIIGI